MDFLLQTYINTSLQLWGILNNQSRCCCPPRQQLLKPLGRALAHPQFMHAVGHGWEKKDDPRKASKARAGEPEEGKEIPVTHWSPVASGSDSQRPRHL